MGGLGSRGETRRRKGAIRRKVVSPHRKSASRATSPSYLQGQGNSLSFTNHGGVMERSRGVLLVPFVILAAALATASNPSDPGSLETAGKVPITTSSKGALDNFLEGRTLFENLKVTDA